MAKALAALAFRAKEAALRRGTFALLPEALAHQHLTRQEIDHLAWERLTQIVRMAAAEVPHYQRMWAGHDIEAALTSPEAFAELPISRRADLTTSGEGFAAPHRRGRLKQIKSSGTTGNKIPFISDTMRSGWSAAARIRARGWWGLEPGASTVSLFSGAFVIGRSFWGRLRQQMRMVSLRLSGQTFLSAFDMSGDDMRRYLAVLQRINPRLLFGYGQSLVRLAELAEREGRIPRLDALQAIIYVSDPMTAQGRATVERVFGANVASEYACSEFGLVAHECRHGALHLSDDNIYVETVDERGRTVVGEIGELVLSDLRPSRTPFIRYRLGDLGELAPADYVCPCGCNQRVLQHFHGRSHHVIPLRDGGCIPPMALDQPLNVMRGASHWQVHVSQPGQPGASLRYDIETTPEILAPLHDQIVAWLEERVNHEYAVTVQAVDHIAPSPSGKYIQIMITD